MHQHPGNISFPPAAQSATTINPDYILALENILGIANRGHRTIPPVDQRHAEFKSIQFSDLSIRNPHTLLPMREDGLVAQNNGICGASFTMPTLASFSLTDKGAQILVEVIRDGRLSNDHGFKR